MANEKNGNWALGVIDQNRVNDAPRISFTRCCPGHDNRPSDPQGQADYDRGVKDAKPDTFLSPNVPVKTR